MFCQFRPVVFKLVSLAQNIKCVIGFASEEYCHKFGKSRHEGETVISSHGY